MKNLSVYLPPFSGDYSGACSALYDINCLIVLCDAACCTKNYINYEEPRWSREKRTPLSAQLRTMQVVMGDEQRIIGQSTVAAKACGAELIVLLGSPVPAMTGMDMQGMAKAIESRSKIPAVGLNTTGFSDYTSGIEKTTLALLKKYMSPPREKIKNGINILGATPIDFGNTGNEHCIARAFEVLGYNIICSYSFGYSLSDVRKSSAAELNIAVSASGLAGAREMKKIFGIPYVAGVPIGPTGAVDVISPAADAPAPPESEKGLLIVSDQVIADSLRNALIKRGFPGRIDIAGFFRMNRELMKKGDKKLRSEEDLINMLKSGKYEILIGDPLLRRIPAAGNVRCIDLPHPAISGPFAWEKVPRFPTDEIEEILNEALK